ncbi:exonuclease subunit SbcD [Pannonibacter sp. Pt2-lr]
MRILHTADLHLGRQFNGLPLEADHDAILGQILDALVSRDADVLVIAGDIFDRAAPPAPAVRQFNAFLSQVASQTRAAVVMIAGNHDSGDRIAAMSVMTDTRRALIRGVISASEMPLVLKDAAGPVAFTGLPFAYEHAARECFSDDSCKARKTCCAPRSPAPAAICPKGRAGLRSPMPLWPELPTAKANGP